MGRGPKASAYFVLFTGKGPSPRQVYSLMREAVRNRGGWLRAGRIGLSQADGQGRYAVAFENDETADQFEALYRQRTGVPVNRRREIPRGMVLVSRQDILLEVVEVLQATCDHPSHPRHKAHLS